MEKTYRIEESRGNIYKYHSFLGQSLSHIIDRMTEFAGEFDVLKIEEVEDVSEGRAYTS